MWVGQGYKDCVNFSLCVMRELRHKIYKDSKEHYSTIYNGLHEPESKHVRELYFQAYEMEWLDSHWDALTDLLKQHKKDCEEGGQREITLFFAKHFSSFMSELDNASPYVKTAMRELIAAQKDIIDQMIMFSDRWEERNNQLKVNLKKHKEYYKRLIESCQGKHMDGRVAE